MECRIRTVFRLLFVIVVAECVLAASAGESIRPPHELHLRLSVDELRHTFSVERHEDVPEYDVLHVRSVRRRRSADGRRRRSLQGRAFDTEIDLDLEVNDQIDNQIRMFYADTPTDDAELTIERVEGDTDMFVGELYQDVAREAALLVDHNADDTLELNGVVGDLVIAPVPHRLRQHVPLNDDDPLLSATVGDDADLEPEMTAADTARMRVRRSTPTVTLGPHVVYRRVRGEQPGAVGAAHLSVDTEDAVTLQDEEEGVEDDQPTHGGRQRRSLPADLYPEVLIIVDYETYQAHKFDAKKLKQYMMSFMNAVDLRFRTVSQPAITVKVAGIVISKTKKATPYLETNMVGGDMVNAVGALSSLGKYLYTEHRLPSYDVALLVTKRDMCTRQGNWGRCNEITAGYAYVGGGCSISKYYNKINSVAIVEDSTGFSGIIVTTHELGHLLGAVHDGSPPASYLGGPGALSCPWEDGYIMSDMRRNYRGLQWSQCSLNQFAHFSSDRRSRCMQNYPSERGGLPRGRTALPGKMMTLDAQCKRDRGSRACFKDHRVCAELYCFEPQNGYCISFRPAAEGSPCGRGMHCMNGVCVPGGYRY